MYTLRNKMLLLLSFPNTIKKKQNPKTLLIFSRNKTTLLPSSNQALRSVTYKLKAFRRAVICNQSQLRSGYWNLKILSKGKQRAAGPSNLKKSKNRETGCFLLIAKGSKVQRTSVIMTEIFSVKRRQSCQTTYCQTTYLLVVLFQRCCI